ncbi:MAG: hypothetical protein A2147_05130 [Chloroflexi bacterium RBG_16_57_8]|nr:MAG: hypothetical protein A2147_05130 [Chloroflexi bacterium RBG_16_57_8]
MDQGELTYEGEHHRKDGSTFPVEIHAKRVKIGDEDIILGVCRDITRRKNTQEKILQSEKKYSTLVEHARDGINIVQGGIVVYSSPKMVEIVGYTPEEIIGRPLLAFIAPADRQSVADRYKKMVSGEPAPERYEIGAIAKDGRYVPIEVSSSVIQYEGKPAVMAVVRDITERRQVEEALRVERENFRNSLEMSPMATQVVGSKGNLVYANRALLELWGYGSFDEFKQVPREKRYTPDSLQLIKELASKQPTPDQPSYYRNQLTIMCNDGRLRNVMAHRTEVIWNGQECTEVLFEDITERLRIEEALQLERENFRNTLEMSPLGAQIVTRDGELVYANQALLDIWGYSSFDELKAVPLRQRVTPETFTRISNIMRDGIQQEQQPSKFEFETSIIRKDGQKRHVQTYRKEVVWNGKESSQILYEDITERKRAEETVQEGERLYRLLAENISDVIFTVDAKDPDRMTFVSPSVTRLLGYTAEEVLAMRTSEIATPDSLKKAASAARSGAVMEDGEKSKTVELDMIHKGGHIVPVEAKYSIIRGAKDQPTQVLAVARDITERKRAEALYRTLADNSPAGVYIIQDSVFVFANAAFKAAIGGGDDDLLGKDSLSLVHPEERLKTRQAAIDMLKGKSAEPYEFRYISKSGETRWALEQVSSITYGGKRATLGSFLDITEMKRAELALREAEQKYDNLVTNIGLGVFRSTLGSSGRFLEVNRAMEAITGYSREELLRINVADTYVNPEERQPLLRAFIDGLGGNAMERVFKKKDGALAFTRTWLTSKKDESGQVLYLEGVMEDVTERKKAEERIQRAAEEWRTTFDSITDLISIHDKENRLVRVNMAFAEKLGTTPKVLIGKKCHELMHSSGVPSKDCPHYHTMETGKSAAIEILTAENATWIQESTSPVFDDQGKVIGTVHIIKDITERKHMEQQLLMTERLATIGELVSGIAHELNNPLTGVIGFSQLLMEREVADDIKEDLSVISGEAQRAARIVKNLLTFARKHAPVKQATQVNSILEDVLRLRAYEQKVNNIEVVRRCAPDLPEIMTDYFQIQQVFLNIIINAEYFMVESHHGGTLTLATERVDGMVRTSITDDGPGIPPDNLARLFDHFFTTKDVGKGTGLGLSICHGIVTEHGGHIYARSEPGKGATFIVDLPVDSGQLNSEDLENAKREKDSAHR